MTEEPIIKVENLTKIFKLPHEKYSTVKQHFINIFKRKSSQELKALDDVSFEVKEGEFFGVIGPNGSGKSTLLKILSKIYQPTSGTIEINGSLSPFIELGVGFNPELTAQENVFLNAAILGLGKKETENKFGEIIRFAELEEFVDQKLKNFSSGMQVRLAFSIAVQAQADILLVDEVLAVGDASFQQKCLEVFRKLKKEGKTIVFVSHALGIIEDFADRVLFLKNGNVGFIGDPAKAIFSYLKLAGEEQLGEVDHGGKKTRSLVSVRKVEILQQDGGKSKFFKTGDKLIIRIYYEAKKKIEKPVFGVALHSQDGTHITGPNTKAAGYQIENIEGKGYLDYVIEDLPFLSGTFLVTVGIFNNNVNLVYDFIDKGTGFKVIPARTDSYGLLKLRESWRLHDK